MSTSNLNLGDFNSRRNAFYKRNKSKFVSKRAEIIAWALFFGVGVAYFVASLVIALV